MQKYNDIERWQDERQTGDFLKVGFFSFKKVPIRIKISGYNME